MKNKKLISKLKRLEFLAYRDDLTTLYNRRGFFNKAKEVFEALVYHRKTKERRKIYQIPFSLIFIDLDNLKKINDKYGHEAGSLALKKIAKILKKRLRSSDIIARFGGDEFVVALIDCDLKSAGEIAEDLRKKIEKSELKYRNRKIKLTISIGVTSYKKEKSLEELINKADKRMYMAKREGKNRVVML